MRAEHFKIRGMEQQFVEFRHLEYNILLTRFERIRVTSPTEESKYLYFIYIFHKQEKIVDKKTKEIQEFNIICFNKVYHTFEEMHKNLDAILSEYILDKEKVFKYVRLAQKLNPQYIIDLQNRE